MNKYDEDQGKSVGGNYGLLDQQMAIKFVVDNCSMIGCDPNQVKIFDETAGSESMSWNTLSPVSAPLLQQAFVELRD